MIKVEFVINWEKSFHARCSRRLADLCAALSSQVLVKRDDEVADGRKLMDLMMLGANEGDKVLFIIDGPDEQAALTAITAWYEQEPSKRDNFYLRDANGNIVEPGAT